MDTQTEDFIETAREYIRLIDSHAELEKDDFFLRCAGLLPVLYAKATLLRERDADTLREDGEDINVERPYDELAAYLGEDNAYPEVFDPIADHDVVTASLADDLSDIYGDVKVGLILWDEGEKNEALWEWWFGFRDHWGNHLVDGMRMLHRLAFPQ